jgi:hypothetical protein
MSATATSMYDFIETFAIREPYNDIHPLSQQLVHNDICDMREMAHHGDDPSHIIKLMHNVRHRIARDLRWAADDCASTHHFKEAYKLRRRANKFEAKQ